MLKTQLLIVLIRDGCMCRLVQMITTTTTDISENISRNWQQNKKQLHYLTINVTTTVSRQNTISDWQLVNANLYSARLTPVNVSLWTVNIVVINVATIINTFIFYGTSLLSHILLRNLVYIKKFTVNVKWQLYQISTE